jgi:hypothetical protein
MTDYTITREIAWPEGVPEMSDEERRALSKKFDAMLLGEMDKHRPTQATPSVYPPKSAHCPDCRGIIICSKHMVWT